MEGPPEDSDTSSTASSHEEDKKDNKKDEAEKPPVEIVFDLQVLYCISKLSYESVFVLAVSRN